ncbi:MAG: hypothetical protein ACI86H_002678 [bacterium]|jgi:hypothetical protein
MLGTITINHQSDCAEYEVTCAKYGFIDDELYIEIDATPNVEHTLAFLGKISVELNGVDISQEIISSLKPISVFIPKSENDSQESETEKFTSIYIGEHYDIDENKVTISNTNAGIVIRWLGVILDPLYDDDRAKPTNIVIETILSPTLFEK